MRIFMMITILGGIRGTDLRIREGIRGTDLRIREGIREPGLEIREETSGDVIQAIKFVAVIIIATGSIARGVGTEPILLVGKRALRRIEDGFYSKICETIVWGLLMWILHKCFYLEKLKQEVSNLKAVVGSNLKAVVGSNRIKGSASQNGIEEMRGVLAGENERIVQADTALPTDNTTVNKIEGPEAAKVDPVIEETAEAVTAENTIEAAKTQAERLKAVIGKLQQEIENLDPQPRISNDELKETIKKYQTELKTKLGGLQEEFKNLEAGIANLDAPTRITKDLIKQEGKLRIQECERFWRGLDPLGRCRYTRRDTGIGAIIN
eukprot:GHVP01050677.1.p1 GENE.GHVP01050677.1~~GHVP01050677.1.p1  ORF type:complete len:338 (+),score=52.64 GHVP01050677.1:46-1014(+)